MNGSVSFSVTGRRKARGKKPCRMLCAACAGNNPGPGSTIPMRARALESFTAYSSDSFAASIYFSTSTGERNSTSAALSKPCPPAPSAGRSCPTSRWIFSSSRTVAVYSSRLSRRICEVPATGPPAQASACNPSSTQFRNAFRSDSATPGPGTVRGGISLLRTREEMRVQRSVSVLSVAGVSELKFRPPYAIFAPWQDSQCCARKARAFAAS